MSDKTEDRPDPRDRPADPAGTRPRHDPGELLPRTRDVRLLGPGSHDGELAGPAPSTALDLPAHPEGALAIASNDAVLPHAPRFQFFMGALLAVAVVAMGVMAAIVLQGERVVDQGIAWSPWQPTKGGGDGAEQIASHVARQYRLPGGRQLVIANGGPLEVAGLPLTVAMRKSAKDGGNIELIEGDGVLYRLCGLGEKCSIPFGKPSKRRHLLLRREALELALYSFRYLKGVDDVAVFMPPPPGQEPSQALFFRRKDLSAELARPLHLTLPAPPPSLEKVTVSANASFVNQLTESTLFQFSLTQANQDNRAYLVLDPFGTPAK